MWVLRLFILFAFVSLLGLCLLSRSAEICGVQGYLWGALNGIGLTLLRLPHPFIMTLGMLNIARGATNLVSGGVPISGVDPQVRYFGQAEFDLSFIQEGAGLPVSLLVVAACTLALWVMLNATPVGRHIYAIGGNPQSARVSGINVDRVLVLVYTICGGLAGLGGLLLVGRTGSAFPNAGLGAELDAIAAVIIGGASFFGGRGTVMGCIAAVSYIQLRGHENKAKDVNRLVLSKKNRSYTKKAYYLSYTNCCFT